MFTKTQQPYKEAMENIRNLFLKLPMFFRFSLVPMLKFIKRIRCWLMKLILFSLSYDDPEEN